MMHILKDSQMVRLIVRNAELRMDRLANSGYSRAFIIGLQQNRGNPSTEFVPETILHLRGNYRGRSSSGE
jgi:hypothetical protein